MFRNRETSFLLTLPVSTQTIFRWKFLESTLLASWAFVFLIAPLLGAYGPHNRAPWHFYVMLPVLVPLFIVLPAVFGSWLAVSLARHMDRRSFQLLIVAALALFVLASRFWLSPEIVDDETLETRMLAVLDRLLVRTRFAQHPLLPSYWLSTSVLSWLEGAMSAAGFFMLVLLSHVLFFGFLAFTWMGPFFTKPPRPRRAAPACSGNGNGSANGAHARALFTSLRALWTSASRCSPACARMSTR